MSGKTITPYREESWAVLRRRQNAWHIIRPCGDGDAGKACAESILSLYPVGKRRFMRIALLVTTEGKPRRRRRQKVSRR